MLLLLMMMMLTRRLLHTPPHVSPAEYAHHPPNLIISANHRVQTSSIGSQVCAVLGQSLKVGIT